MRRILLPLAVLLLGAMLLPIACRSKPPTARLMVISPHSRDIQREFTEAFARWSAERYGETVEVVFRDVGGGSTAVLAYLRNAAGAGGSSGIDVVWGGGSGNFQKMADEGMLAPMQLAPDVAENIPAERNGVALRDPGGLWCGTSLSGFGFLYNKPLLEKLSLPPPQTWDDLAGPAFADQLALADPTQSGTALTAYEMIVQTAPDWPAGWAKLLAVLANARKIYDSSSAAADAPVLGESPVAACIDFYGRIRAAKTPGAIVYVNPRGQTAYDPDPIAILRGAPQPLWAQRLVEFVLSRPGQALWALPAGAAEGPARTTLGRLPIRKDIYAAYRGRLAPWIADPYEADARMKIDVRLRQLRAEPLQRLVHAAAIDNLEGLRAARRKVLRGAPDPARLAEFNRLPDDAATEAALEQTAAKLKDPAQAERITTAWAAFFREKYRRMSQ